ncbi:MAG: ferrochelatase [Micromonosporaceae bacterium]
MTDYDALLLLSFGGPEGPDDVMPFLRNVTRGRDVPDSRLAVVAEHYRHFGGVSPINQQNRQLLAAVRAECAAAGVDLPWYWGNRNWHPLLADTLRQMRQDGVRRALAFVTSGFGSYSSCRQYLDDIEAARAKLGDDAPAVDKIRHFHDHPGYVEPHADAVRAALDTLPEADPESTRLVFTAHSIPQAMNRQAGPRGRRYTDQLSETARLVAERAAPELSYNLVWQSRSGPPQVPWLEPDVNDHLEELTKAGVRQVVVSPIGFVSDHLEVVWDLDNEAAATAQRLGLGFMRAATPGVDRRFVAMVRELVRERLVDAAPQGWGALPLWHTCPPECCR